MTASNDALSEIADNREAALEHLKDAGINLADCTWGESCQIQVLQGIGYALLDVADAIREQTAAEYERQAIVP